MQTIILLHANNTILRAFDYVWMLANGLMIQFFIFWTLTQSSENTERVRKGPRSESFSISLPSACDNGEGIQEDKCTI